MSFAFVPHGPDCPEFESAARLKALQKLFFQNRGSLALIPIN